MQEDPRRRTPRTDTVLDDERLRPDVARLGRARVKTAVVAALGRSRAGEIAPESVLDEVLRTLPPGACSMRRVVNATGVVVHTNLGRAPLSDAAREALAVAAGFTDVELDLVDGQRARRGAGALDALAAAVPDAGGVHVVNNGAAALALVTAALVDRHVGRTTVVVARGEMVEIGDGFRVPDLVTSAGASLREVGTTNRVGVADYAAAIDETTAFVLKVHPSNFRVEGFTSSVPVRDLAGLGVPVVADTGSGLLAPHPRLPEEPDAATALRQGAALVTASGDKLLGGPQCGLVLGEADLVERVRRFPLARAMRVDKLTLAALEATLAGPRPPVPEMLATDPSELRARAERMAKELAPDIDVEAVDSEGRVGGGGAPGVVLPSAALALPASWASALRTGEPPVVGRVSDGRLLLDLLTVAPDAEADLLRAVRAVAEAARDAAS